MHSPLWKLWSPQAREEWNALKQLKLSPSARYMPREGSITAERVALQLSREAGSTCLPWKKDSGSMIPQTIVIRVVLHSCAEEEHNSWHAWTFKSWPTVYVRPASTLSGSAKTVQGKHLFHLGNLPLFPLVSICHRIPRKQSREITLLVVLLTVGRWCCSCSVFNKEWLYNMCFCQSESPAVAAVDHRSILSLTHSNTHTQYDFTILVFTRDWKQY